MYVCGLTVYDFMHIGHARMMIVFDVVKRYLRHRGYRVTHVRNITDIDDRIIQRAAENGEPIGALTERFITAMNEDCDALGVLRPDFEPRATEYLPPIIAMVEKLIAGGYAYLAPNGDVMYAVAKFDGYGRLSGKRLADLRAGARVEIDESKRDPLDFVLWKHAKPGEPAWDSPWGKGRPGWHIECSAMSVALLGSHFDIHGGGLDLKFPHHENEIAQTCAATGDRFAEIWMHNGFVNIDNEKMSKSLGNFFTVREVLAEGGAPSRGAAFLRAREPLPRSDQLLARAARAGGCGARKDHDGAARSAGVRRRRAATGSEYCGPLSGGDGRRLQYAGGDRGPADVDARDQHRKGCRGCRTGRGSGSGAALPGGRARHHA